MSELLPSALRPLREGAALVELGGLEVLVARGAERLTFLHRLLTADIASLGVGQGRRALLLTPKAHIAVDLVVLVRSDDVLLIVPPAQGASAAAALSRYAVMDDVTFAVAPDRKVLGVFGPRAADVLTSAAVPVPASLTGAWAHADSADVTLVRTTGFGSQGFWLIADATRLAGLEQRLTTAGVHRLAPDAAEAARIAAGEPAWALEITGDHFPMEVGLSGAIDYAKGCYLGQEPIVRIRDRGHVNWRLARLRFEADALPAPGDTLESGARPQAGRITSAAFWPGDGTGRRIGWALGLVHASVADGALVRIVRGEQRIDAVVEPAAAPV